MHLIRMTTLGNDRCTSVRLKKRVDGATAFFRYLGLSTLSLYSTLRETVQEKMSCRTKLICLEIATLFLCLAVLFKIFQVMCCSHNIDIKPPT